MSSYGLEIIKSDECEALLLTQRGPDESAYAPVSPGVFPVLYALLDGDVVFRTAAGEEAGSRRRSSV